MVNPANAQAIVDDQGPGVQFDGQWQRQGSSLEFASTTSISQTQGATAKFTFDGTSITVYGTVTTADASMDFAIDGRNVGNFKASGSLPGAVTQPGGVEAVHHLAIWKSPTLSPGSHTLVITQGPTNEVLNNNRGIYLDYLLFSPSTSASSVGLRYLVDDQDPRIQYSNWGVSQAESHFGHSIHESRGDGARMTITFDGTRISIFGDVNRGGQSEMGSVVIDGGSPRSIAPAQGTAQELFSVEGLSQGRHTLVLTTKGSDTLGVDYVLITPGDLSSSSPQNPPVGPNPTSGPPSPSNSSPPNALPSNSAPSVLPTAPSVNPSSSLPSGTDAAPSTPTTPDASSEDHPPDAFNSKETTPKPNNTAGIAGGAAGGLSLLILLLVFLLLWRRRKRLESVPGVISLNSPVPLQDHLVPWTPATVSVHSSTPGSSKFRQHQYQPFASRAIENEMVLRPVRAVSESNFSSQSGYGSTTSARLPYAYSTSASDDTASLAPGGSAYSPHALTFSTAEFSEPYVDSGIRVPHISADYRPPPSYTAA